MLDKLRQKFDDHKIGAMFVTNETNIFYLTGFRGTNGYALVTRNHLYLFTDARYMEKAEKSTSDDCRVVDMAPGMMNIIHNTLIKHRINSFGIEEKDITVDLYKQLNALNGFKIHETADIIEQIRMIKRADELRMIRQSQKFNEQVLKLVLDDIKIGKTEADLAWKIRSIAHDLGACGLSFDPIVAFGGHTSMPHHEGSHKKKLKRGDMVLIDMGMKCQDYCSDMTRTFFTKVPTSQQAEVYQTVLEAQQQAIRAAKPGVETNLVDKAARKYISRAGYKKKFSHGTGHGVGLDVHEYPRIHKFINTVLQPGMVVTIEPGIYLPGKLGVRIEDMVEIREKGNQVLTKFGKVIEDVIVKI